MDLNDPNRESAEEEMDDLVEHLTDDENQMLREIVNYWRKYFG